METVLLPLTLWAYFLSLSQEAHSIGTLGRTPVNMSVAEGNPVELPCVTSATLAEWNLLFWFKQEKIERGPLVLILSNKRKQLTEARYQLVSRDQKKTSLRIQNVVNKDSGIYYCVSKKQEPNLDMPMFGDGVRVIVESKIAKHSRPQMRLLFPPRGALIEGTVAAAVCLVTDFYPKEITVSMKTSSSAVKRFGSAPLYRGDGRYTAAVFLPMDQWRPGDVISCKVNHATAPNGTVVQTDYGKGTEGRNCSEKVSRDQSIDSRTGMMRHTRERHGRTLKNANIRALPPADSTMCFNLCQKHESQSGTTCRKHVVF
uniref:immunoglobulin lambda-1 light chain-like isoform X2 n=1 Tax=Pristiophorus japonicus TaxID=55135 RepID=UPI00398E5FDA